MPKIIILHNYHPRSEAPDITNDLSIWNILSKDIKVTLLNIARSQCQVFRYLVKKIALTPNTIILMENSDGWEPIGPDKTLLDGNIDVNLMNWKWLTKLFPLTTDCDNLNLEQIAWLTKAGVGAQVIMGVKGYKIYRNYLPPYSIESTALDDSQYSWLDARRQEVYQAKEFLTLLRAWELIKKNPSEDAVITYGYSHPFLDVAKCIKEMRLPIEIKQLYEPTPLTPEAAELYKQILNARPTPNCTKLAEIARTHGFPGYGQEKSNHIFSGLEEEDYTFSIKDSMYALGKGAGYVFLSRLLYAICLKRGYSPVQAKVIAELVKIVALCYENGATSLITPAITSILCSYGISYGKAQIISNLFNILTITTLLMPNITTALLFRVGMNFIHGLVGGIVGYLSFEGMKALTNNSDIQTIRKITNKDIKALFLKHPKLKRYRFCKKSCKRVSKFFIGKKNLDLNSIANQIYSASKYSSNFGFFKDCFTCTGKTKCYIPKGAFSKNMDIQKQ
ncbi:MAG: hypothetical protein PVI75_00510 [Gammaproteobacteria bacterium]|jgi:hypothetical protein